MDSDVNEIEIMPKLSTNMLTLGVEIARIIHNYLGGIRGNCVVR